MADALYDELLRSVEGNDCEVRRVVIGLHWTAVQSRFTGMAHTYKSPSHPEVDEAGRLVGQSALGLARRVLSWDPLEASLGLAALNSLIDARGVECDVNRQMLEDARGRAVAVVGRFPFNDEVRRMAKAAYFLEIEPQPDELPAAAAESVIPKADVVVITASALINRTMPRLLDLARGKRCYVMGPSTPMNEVLLDYGAQVLEGLRLTDADALIDCVGQGVKKFRHLLGIQTISLTRQRAG